MSVIQDLKLAISGGPPVRKRPFAPWPYFAPDEVAELGETSLMFLVHPTLSESDVRETASAVEKVFARATKG